MINGISDLYQLKQLSPEKALNQACREFEAIFAHQLMKVMGDTVQKGGLYDEGLASDIYRDMLFEAIGNKVAESGMLGIGSVLKQRMQSGVPGHEYSSAYRHIR
jgi:Rod binding domain-containing protein